jgi:exodeoxyribonuclease III
MKCAPRHDTNGKDATRGRLIAVEIDGKFNILASYNPNSGADPKKPLKNLGYRVKEWDPALFAVLEELRASKPTIWLGDINVAPQEMDVSHPKEMALVGGFAPEERESLAGFLKTGKWIDIWRAQHPNTITYTYRGEQKKWSSAFGLRLDNIIVSEDMKKNVLTSYNITDYPAPTDHIPITVLVKGG